MDVSLPKAAAAAGLAGVLYLALRVLDRQYLRRRGEPPLARGGLPWLGYAVHLGTGSTKLLMRLHAQYQRIARGFSLQTLLSKCFAAHLACST